MIVNYSCAKCGLSNIGVSIVDRTTESKMIWSKRLTDMLWADHAQRSPACQTQTLDFAWPL